MSLNFCTIFLLFLFWIYGSRQYCGCFSLSFHFLFVPSNFNVVLHLILLSLPPEPFIIPPFTPFPINALLCAIPQEFGDAFQWVSGDQSTASPHFTGLAKFRMWLKGLSLGKYYTSGKFRRERKLGNIRRPDTRRMGGLGWWRKYWWKYLDIRSIKK